MELAARAWRPVSLVLLAAAVVFGSWVARPLFPSLQLDLALGEADYRVTDTPAGQTIDVRYTGVIVELSLLTAFACGAAVLLVRRWRAPLYATTLVGWLAFGMWPAIVVASYQAGTTLRRGGELWAYVVAAGSAIVMPSLIRVTVNQNRIEPEWLPIAVLEAALLLGVPVLAGLLVRARRELRGGARARDEGLRREQAARYAQARAQERARIAREMHDVVAHRVSLMVLHAGALEVNAPDEATASAAALIRSTGRDALTDLREVLGVLRSPDASLEPAPGLADLDRLIASSRALGVAVERRDEGTPRSLPVAVERAAYRVVQEALTNVHRHAGDAAAEVVVRHRPDALRVDVRNAPSDTSGAGAGLPGSGLGLAGLRERVELLGGTFAAGPTADGGFLVTATLPSTEPASPPSTEPALLQSSEPASLLSSGPASETAALPASETAAMPASEPAALPSLEAAVLPASEAAALPVRDGGDR